MSINQLRSTEIYLTNLDDHLLARGVDPRVRLDYVEQVADAVMTSGVDAEEEFGSAETYAAALAESLGSGHRRPWARVLAVGLGVFLAFQGLLGLDSYQRRRRWDLLDVPEDILLPMSLVVPLLWAFGAWIQLSPTGVRLVTARLNRLRGRWLAGSLIALLVVVIAVMAIGPYSIELASTRAMLPAFVIGVVVGPALIWWSGFPQLGWSVMSIKARRGSSMSYNSFGAPKVRLSDRGPTQSPRHPSPTGCS